MAIFPIGDQRVGIVRDMPVLDEFNQPVYGDDPLDGPRVEPVTIWVDNALFEVQTPTERPDFATTTNTIAIAELPISKDRVIPAVDDDGEDASLAFYDDDGKPNITANARIVSNGVEYEIRGDVVLEEDIRGRADHVFISCGRTN